MEYSRYNCYLDHYPNDGYITIYNLFTRKAVCYKRGVVSSITDPCVANKLETYGIMVDSIETEKNEALEKYRDKTGNLKKLKLMLVLTGCCNCNCTYCYERETSRLPEGFFNVDKILWFAKNKCEENDVQSVEIIYYGGEPLLQMDLITEISEKFYDRYGNNFNFSIITNGTLIDAEYVRKWKTIGLKTLKISIDGCKGSNDKRRIYKSGEGTYDDIIRNLGSITEDVEIRVNIVIDEKVYGVKELINDLDRSGVHATFSLNPVEPWRGTEKERADLILRYAKIFKEHGLFQYSKMSGTHGDICEAKYKNFYVLDGDGIVYECNGEFKVIGTVDSDIKRTEFLIRSQCETCKYLPICYGDCIYHEICQKDYFDYLIPRLLKIYLSYNNVE